MKNVASSITGGQSSANETDFSELFGTYTIAKGILHNNDLQMISPELPVTGAGTVDLPRREVDYRLTPSLEGIVAVPVSITGSWDDLSYRPDLTALGKNIISQPGKALDVLKDQGSGAADFLKGLLGR
jgi:AsmA protein